MNNPLGRSNDTPGPVFADMESEKVPMCKVDDLEDSKDLGDVNRSQQVQGVKEDGTTTGDNEDESSDVPPNGRPQESGFTPTNGAKQTVSFEGGRKVVQSSVNEKVIKNSGSADV